MTLSPCPQPKLQLFSDAGLPLAGGYLYTYVSGQPGVPKSTYTDSLGTAYNTNPIVLDSAGRCSVWLDGYYAMQLWTGDKTVAGSSQVWSVDNIGGELTTVTDFLVLPDTVTGTLYNITIENGVITPVEI